MTHRPPAIGCLNLSARPTRDDARSLAVLAAALGAGVRLFDTADAYALDAADMGHNERLLRAALAAFPGDRSSVRIATKGGLTRPAGRWVPNGKAGHLRRACEASLEALGLSRVDLYQLHVVDPKTPLAVSARALAELRREGLAARIGLCNVTVPQIEAARGIVEVSSVQIRLGPLDTDALRSGLVSYCVSNGIQVLAYRPFGGSNGARRIARDPALAAIARRHGRSPHDVALAWLLDLGPNIVPLPGPSREETASACARAAEIQLTDEDRAELDAHFPEGGALRRGEDPGLARRVMVPVPERTGPAPEVVLVMGCPGAGKSTATRELLEQGYARLNRDEKGGRLAGVALLLDETLAAGADKVVMDNTYPSRALRRDVLDIAARHGASARCIWIDTSVEQSQVNACERMVARYGKLLLPEEMAKIAKQDPNSFPPRAQFQYRRLFEAPDAAEGFTSVERRAFERRPDPERVHRALFIELDGVLWTSRAGARTPGTPEDLEIAGGHGEVLRKYSDEGWLLVGFTWQPEIAEKKRSPEDVNRTFEALRSALDLPMSLLYCPHGGGPPVCWCRKPLPGLGVLAAHTWKIAPSRSLHVGKSTADRQFAERLGMEYREAEGFFLAQGS